MSPAAGKRLLTPPPSLIRRLAVLSCLAQCMAAAPARAETAAPAGKVQDDVGGKKLELKGVEDTIDASAAQRATMERELDSIRSDRAKLNAALMDATAKIGAADACIVDSERRLDTLTGSEEAIRRSLDGRKRAVGDVLAVLQRMGRRTPPALLVRPEDMLQAIRASMLLGAVLPEMRAETEALAGDLKELIGLRAAITDEKQKLAVERSGLDAERTRLAALVEARQKSLGEVETALAAEQKRAAALAQQAGSLKDLIARMEADSEGARKALESARKADEDREKQAALETQEQRDRIAASPFKDGARLAPAVAFVQTKARLPMPANGEILRNYGSSDGYGGAEKGLSIATRPRAVVVSPTDGWIMFAAPWRTYGQLLIVNAGDGYYIVLAGMERTDVAVGQFVLAGEPVGAMGDGQTRTASAVAIGASQPILYVEFRKDGAPIDPSPWWAKPDIKKVRG
ncbi:MAG: peptidoglycan DD-metalloendopeptidase family protein [Hyphomicrobiales bacterium]|nr:peptidoglycan DD-metalloendopeptidase family protein [Hyphomicrobiales bacterium]